MRRTLDSLHCYGYKIDLESTEVGSQWGEFGCYRKSEGNRLFIGHGYSISSLVAGN